VLFALEEGRRVKQCFSSKLLKIPTGATTKAVLAGILTAAILSNIPDRIMALWN
jgi:hypothetical protein